MALQLDTIIKQEIVSSTFQIDQSPNNTKLVAHLKAFPTLYTQYQILMIQNDKCVSGIRFELVLLLLLLLLLRPLKPNELIMAHTGIWCGVVCVLKTEETFQMESEEKELPYGKIPT